MKHWTIGRTVALSFACIATLMLAGGLFCIGLIRRTLASVQPVANQHLPLGDLAHEFERRVLNARIHFIYYVTIQKEGSKALGWEQFEGARRTLPKLESVARSCGVDEVSRETELLAANFAAYEVVLRRILDTVDRGDNRGPEFAALIRQWAATGAAMVSQGGKLSRLANEKTAQALSHTNATLESSIWITWGGCLGLLILAMMFGWLMIRSLNRKLRTIAEHVSDSANAFAGAAADVADSSRQVADGAAEQASTLERTLRAAEQVSATARELDQSADAAAETASRAEAEIVAADRGLESALGAMREIASSGASIGRIIRIVDEIAFQTNILALNAAVEAARAGEAGAGFAIVAGEVRRLAQRSAAAARETEDLIELASARTAAGSDRLTSVSQAVKRIGEFVVELKAVVERVNGGSARQLTDLRHVAGTIGQMESLTQRSVASAGLTAESARTLSDEAQTLRLTAEGLTSMVGSGA